MARVPFDEERGRLVGSMLTTGFARHSVILESFSPNFEVNE
jgi:hypothetical protein